MTDPEEDPSQDFFQRIESQLHVIPEHSKKLLTLHGYNNVSLGNLTEDDVKEIERFTRSDLELIVKPDEIPHCSGFFIRTSRGF